MNFLSRALHLMKFRHYLREASRTQRDLTEYVQSENCRISILLHRAAWHRTKASGQMVSFEAGPPAPRNSKLVELKADNTSELKAKEW